jgi:ATP synthase protein I
LPRFARWGMMRTMPNTDSQRNDSRGNYARFFHVGFAFVFIIGVITAGGYGLDRLFGTLPLFLLLGMAGGFAAALFYLFFELKKLGGE